MDETMVIKTICKNTKTIIDKQIFLFVFVLFTKIFLIQSEKENDENKNKEINEKLKSWIEYINKKIIKKEEKFISEEYTKENMENIFALVIHQNKIYAPDIIEAMLIYIFSMVFKSDKDKTLNQYIFNNISEEFKSSSKFEIAKMIDISKIKQNEFKKIKQLLDFDYKEDDKPYLIHKYFKKEEVESEIYNILNDILSLKYINIIKELKAPSKLINYINKYIYKLENLYIRIDESTTLMDKEYYILPNFVNEFYYKDKFGIDVKVPIKMFRSFLISVFIYYVNKTSPLMKYIEPLHKEEEKKNLAYIPFEYNLEGAAIKEELSNIIISPARFEPRITKLNFGKNFLKSFGLYELGKLLIFNKNIKSVKLDHSNLKNVSLEFIKFGMKIHENDTLEELILINNEPLTNQSGIFLAKIIGCFRGLKTLNLCDNDFKWGLSPLFAVLKKLYRKGKTKLEILKLNNCHLDNESFYELGELISSKYCKLKKLYLRSNNDKNINFSHFLKKLKKNNSITEIYLGKTSIYNNNVDEILRIISNAKIRHLYLNSVNIENYIELLRIIYRTKIIKEENDKYININESFLFNLDLSFNRIYFSTSIFIKLLIDIIENSTILCLDISHIIKGNNNNKFDTKKASIIYINEVNKLEKILKTKREKYIKNMKEIKKSKVDIERNKSLENEEKFKDLKLDKIIKSDKAKFPLFFRQEANNIIKDKFRNINDLNKKKEMVTKLIQYMTLKKSRYDLEVLEKEIKDKKLIII